MATATEISTRALRRLKVVSPDSSPSGADLASAQEALTAMINSWEGDGLSGDVLPLDARFEQGVVAMLAVRLAEEFGKTPGPVLVRDADNGWSQIQAAFISPPEATFDSALTFVSRNPQYNIASDAEISPSNWQASAVYALRQYVTNNKLIYECVTAGTSASSGGPEGTDAEITDGTVVWCFRKVEG